MGSLEYPWFAFDVADWEGATAVMTDEQQGAYMRLLCFGWKEDGLPVDPAAVRALGRWTASAWKRIWPALESKWPIVGDRRRNKRQEIERAAARKRRSDAQAKAHKKHAAAGAAAGAAAQPEQSRSDAGAVLDGCKVQGSVPQPVQEPVQREIGTLSSPRAGAFDLHPKQLEATASGLYAAWNNVACARAPELTRLEYDPPYSPTVHRALTAHPEIDWWADTFARVAESDWLCGRVAGRDGTPFLASFWWVIERIDRAENIHSYGYRNRERVAANADVRADLMKELA